MDIVYRVVQAALTELVFESPYGNKVHFIMDPDKFRGKAHRYWMETSPSIKLKMVQKMAENDWLEFTINAYMDQFDRWSDPSAMYAIGDISRALSARYQSQFLPWLPCREDWDLVKGYLIDNLSVAKNCLDRDLMVRYNDEAARARGANKQRKVIDLSDERLEKLSSLVGDTPDLWAYNSKHGKELPEFVSSLIYPADPQNIIAKFLLRKIVSRELVEYMLSKVKGYGDRL